MLLGELKSMEKLYAVTISNIIYLLLTSVFEMAFCLSSSY